MYVVVFCGTKQSNIWKVEGLLNPHPFLPRNTCILDGHSDLKSKNIVIKKKQKTSSTALASFEVATSEKLFFFLTGDGASEVKNKQTHTVSYTLSLSL